MYETIYFFKVPHLNGQVFSLEEAGISYCDGSYRIQRDSAYTYVLEYVTQGTGTVHFKDQVFHPRAGDVYFLHQRMKHDYYSDARDPWTKLWFNVRGTLLDHLVQAYGLSDFCYLENAGPALLEIFKKGIHAAKIANQRKDSLKIHFTIAPVVLQILMAISVIRKTDTMPDIVKRIKEYIDHHFSGPLSLKDICHEAGRSPSQATRLFKKEIGLSPYSYVLERRVNEAKFLLRDSVMPIKNIAEQIGFSDEYHFSSYFKKRSGFSPLAWRKQ